MSSYDNRYNDIDDEPDFDYVNDDYGFDMDDDKEPSARTSTGASKNHKKKKASKPVTIWSEIFSYIKILAAAVIIAFVFTQYIIVNAEVPTLSFRSDTHADFTQTSSQVGTGGRISQNFITQGLDVGFQ